MTTLIRLFLIFGAILISSPSFAFTDLCKMENDFLSQTTAQTNEYFQRNLSGRRVEGKGVVEDVEAGPNKECFIIVRCGNQVFVNIPAKFEGSVKDLTVGRAISFTGECVDFEKAYCRNSDEKCISFILDTPSLRY